MSQGTADAAFADGILFNAELFPHRSLSRLGFWLLMATIAAASFAIGLGFFLAGAWPVVGFLGLDVLLIYWAFRVNYRAARVREVLELTEDALIVRRFAAGRAPRTWTFQPYWLKVSMADPPRHDSRLVLSSHGNQLAIGAFLSPPERLEVARALMTALARLDNVHHR
jgi:uncharacterized membrane protein